MYDGHGILCEGPTKVTLAFPQILSVAHIEPHHQIRLARPSGTLLSLGAQVCEPHLLGAWVLIIPQTETVPLRK